MDILDFADQLQTTIDGLATARAQLIELQAQARKVPDAGQVLAVPYLSQWGVGADERRGDCGPACDAGIIHFTTAYRPTVDQVADACGQPTTPPGENYTDHAQLRTGARAFGVELETRSPYTERYGKGKLTLDLLKAQVDAGKPSIVLLHYGVLRDRTNPLAGYVHNQDQNYARGHWCLFVGYDGGDVVINDPDFWGSRAGDGDHRRIPADAFEAALAAVAPGCTVGFQGLIVR